MHSNPIRRYYTPVRAHSLRAGGGESGEEHSPVGTVVGEALLSRWVCVTISDTTVTRSEQEGDTTGTKRGKARTDTVSISVWNYIPVVRVCQPKE
jgi:hypothetical protein